MVLKRFLPVLMILGGACGGEPARTSESDGQLSLDDFDTDFQALTTCVDAVDPEQCYSDAGGFVLAEEAKGNPEIDRGGCWVTGIGHIGDENEHPGAGRADQDSFGGNAMGMKDDTVRGQWQNTTHTGHVFHGQATWLRCWKDSGLGPEVPRAIPNNAEWGGPGKWDHQDGYTFRVHAQDRAEGGHHIDTYSIIVYDSTGAVTYEQPLVHISGGNFQIHPPNNGHPYSSRTAPQ
jgi:hypothetical protein